jgi:hypothetical protein
MSLSKFSPILSSVVLSWVFFGVQSGSKFSRFKLGRSKLGHSKLSRSKLVVRGSVVLSWVVRC